MFSPGAREIPRFPQSEMKDKHIGVAETSPSITPITHPPVGRRGDKP